MGSAPRWEAPILLHATNIILPESGFDGNIVSEPVPVDVSQNCIEDDITSATTRPSVFGTEHCRLESNLLTCRPYQPLQVGLSEGVHGPNRKYNSGSAPICSMGPLLVFFVTLQRPKTFLKPSQRICVRTAI